MPVKKYRLVAYQSGGLNYIQLVRDIKRADGSWTTRAVKHIGLINAENREKAQELLNFLEKYASSEGAPIPVGTIDEDFLAGLRLGVLLGPRRLPMAPIVLFRDFISSFNFYLEHVSGGVSEAVDATQIHLSTPERRRLLKWMETTPTHKDKAIALFFKWQFEE
jgi:hypothetical protein